MGKYSNAINEALKAHGDIPRWCLWKYTDNPENPDKPKKSPINPKTGRGAMANEPSTWADFDTAYIARFVDKSIVCDGFGFFVGGGYAGIDLDNCIDDSGNLSDMAVKIVQRMDTYTEVSPRGHGLHILCRVSEGLTLEGKQGARKPEIEIYCGAHYLTITGNVYGDEKPIEYRENELLEIYHEYFVVPRENDAKKQAQNVSQGQNNSRITGNESDNELWGRMFESEKGREIRALYNGDISAYDNDNSRADLALCCYLAYWTGHDAVRIDNMFRQSRLMRSKWNEMRGTQTYGTITITKAMNDTPRYSPPVNVASTSIKDWDFDPANYHPESHGEIPNTESDSDSEKESAGNSESEPRKERIQHHVLDYLEKSFYSDIERTKTFQTRKTGYSNIDRYNSLLPGLYVVGSVTGNGKTTFCGQMADYLAQAGEHVLYYALEQTELELVSKGLARLTAREVIKKHGADALMKYQHTDAMTAIDIRNGETTGAVKRAIETYKEFASRLYIIECDFNTNAESITKSVEGYIEKFGVKPVVFVDYLQIVKPAKETAKTAKRDSIDDTVQRFKKLSKDNDLAVFVISSLNRQNYLSVVDNSSFKESGGIEYTADSVWGLQLLCMNAQIFNTDSDLQTKRKFVRKHKNATPRKMELCISKNRYGRDNSRYFFDYYSAYDLFIPYERPKDDARTDDEFADELDAQMSAEFDAYKLRFPDEIAKTVGGKRKPPKI